MISSPQNFERVKSVSKLQQRLEMIMQYVIYCYSIMCKEEIKYKKEDSKKEDGKYHLEVYLNKRLVDDYLNTRTNTATYKKLISNDPCVSIFFSNEPSQTLNDNKDEFIDIQIFESTLDSLMANETPNHIYFAIECKLISNGYSEYVSDIEKFCNYNHTTFRLPFESQIGYILNPKYTTEHVAKGINENLKRNTQITTLEQLKHVHIVENFDGSYVSKHKRNYNDLNFTDYHLLFNYSEIVI